MALVAPATAAAASASAFLRAKTTLRVVGGLRAVLAELLGWPAIPARLLWKDSARVSIDFAWGTALVGKGNGKLSLSRMLGLSEVVDNCRYEY